MAGTADHRTYVSDDGNTYRILMPTWQSGLTGDAVLASGQGLPRGYQRRHRMIQDTATGKEIKITVGSITSASWTAAFGSVATVTPPGHAATTWHYAGRIGERDLIRG